MSLFWRLEKLFWNSKGMNFPQVWIVYKKEKPWKSYYVHCFISFSFLAQTLTPALQYCETVMPTTFDEIVSFEGILKQTCFNNTQYFVTFLGCLLFHFHKNFLFLSYTTFQSYHLRLKLWYYNVNGMQGSTLTVAS